MRNPLRVRTLSFTVDKVENKIDSKLEDPAQPMIPSPLVDLILQSSFKDLSIPRHRDGEAAAVPSQVVKGDREARLFDLASSSLNNNFEHQCFDVAVQRLGALPLPAMEGDIGPHVFGIPGIPKGRFLPQQVWGIWFLVGRVVGVSPPVALLADDWVLGKCSRPWAPSSI